MNEPSQAPPSSRTAFDADSHPHSPRADAARDAHSPKNTEADPALLALVGKARLLDQLAHIYAEITQAQRALKDAQTRILKIEQQKNAADRDMAVFHASLTGVYIQPGRAARAVERHVASHGLASAVKTLRYHPQDFGPLRTTVHTRYGGLVAATHDQEARTLARTAADKAQTAWSSLGRIDSDAQRAAADDLRTAQERVSALRARVTKIEDTTPGGSHALLLALSDAKPDEMEQLLRITGWSRERMGDLLEPGKILTSNASPRGFNDKS